MSITELGIIIGLLAGAIPLVALARRANVAYPIVLVVAGLALGFVPDLPEVRLDPDLVLLVFLPPLLYWEAITAPTDVMLENAGQIGLLAVGLVIVTTVAVAVVAHAIVPGLPWGAAFVLGAIVSPTDELAAVPVLERFRLPRHVIAIAEGESLLNDATSLVIYASAITVVTMGVFHAGGTFWSFLVTVGGSAAVGYVAARLAVESWRRIKDSQLQGVISFILPFVAYVPSQLLGLSGVLAVITAGVYANRYTPRVLTAEARLQLVGFWETLVFLANAVLFLILGLQLHRIADAAFEKEGWMTVVGYAIEINVVLIAVRLAGVLAAEYAPTAAPADHAAPDWKHALVVAWSGLRGAVSLAAALAIPLTLPGGAEFPHRDAILFITFSVILVTLVGGGLTLPWVVRLLHVEAGADDEADELRAARLRSADAALTRISELEAQGRIDARHASSLRKRYEHQRELSENTGADGVEHKDRHIEVERAIIAAQRQTIIEMRERGEIDNTVLRRLQGDLDRAVSRL